MGEEIILIELLLSENVYMGVFINENIFFLFFMYFVFFLINDRLKVYKRSGNEKCKTFSIFNLNGNKLRLEWVDVVFFFYKNSIIKFKRLKKWK